jgi:hypothetical protein
VSTEGAFFEQCLTEILVGEHRVRDERDRRLAQGTATFPSLEHYGVRIGRQGDEPMTYLDQLAVKIQQIAEPGAPMADSYLPLFRLYAVLALATGDGVTDADVHNAWSAWAIEHRAWSPHIRPFHELTPDVQAQDRPYTEAICRVATQEGL